MKVRLAQFTLIASTFGFCWLGMQAVHELGHVVAAWVAGATVHRVVLHPLVISRTDFSRDRHPLLVIWGGPVLCVVLPLFLLGVARLRRSSLLMLSQFFAGFCLVANGAYIGMGSFGGVGDAGDLARHGCPQWAKILFGLICAPAGLWLWDGLGPCFGLKASAGQVDRLAVRWAVGLFLGIVVLEIIGGYVGILGASEEPGAR